MPGFQQHRSYIITYEWLVVEDTRIPGGKPWPTLGHWQLSHMTRLVFEPAVGTALMAMWYKALPLNASHLSPLYGFKSQLRHVRKLPVTWG